MIELSIVTHQGVEVAQPPRIHLHVRTLLHLAAPETPFHEGVAAPRRPRCGPPHLALALFPSGKLSCEPPATLFIEELPDGPYT
jgi:hypothetical protein